MAGQGCAEPTISAVHPRPTDAQIPGGSRGDLLVKAPRRGIADHFAIRTQLITANHGRHLRGFPSISNSLPVGASAQTAVITLSSWSGTWR
ncbi:hypothetical protein [Lapidilactobacillus salsurivasis]